MKDKIKLGETKNNWNRVAGIILSIIIIFYVTFFLKGLSELVENQTAGISTFYGLIAVFITWRLGDFLKSSLRMVFNKEGFRYD